ncbi:MAG: HlyC/CorC family transporter [Thermoprotei archaeon]|nr:MAG: HlyC/CorC family transporter [Thermoprotei archaeon]
METTIILSFAGALIAAIFLYFVSTMEVAIFSLKNYDVSHLGGTRKWLIQLTKRSGRIEAFFISAKGIFLGLLAVCIHIYFENTVVAGHIFVRYLIEGVLFASIAVLSMIVLPSSAVNWDERKTLAFSWLLFVLYVLIYPITIIARVVLDFILRRSGLEEGLRSLAMQRQLAYIAEDSTAPLEAEERTMIRHIMDFVDTTVREVMVPRIDMVCAPVDSAPEQIIELIKEHGHSRIPLYQGKIDNIVGILYAKDLLISMGENGGEIKLARICRKPYFVPESKLISDLLEEFKREKLHIAIVVDEFGGVAGLVTMEDLLEEIVGEIQDEYDEEEELVRRLDENVWLVSGKTPIDEFNEIADVELPEQEDADTIAGLVYQLTGTIPKPGDKIEIPEQNLIIIVDSLDAQRIDKVKIIKKGKEK